MSPCREVGAGRVGRSWGGKSELSRAEKAEGEGQNLGRLRSLVRPAKKAGYFPNDDDGSGEDDQKEPAPEAMHEVSEIAKPGDDEDHPSDHLGCQPPGSGRSCCSRPLWSRRIARPAPVRIRTTRWVTNGEFSRRSSARFQRMYDVADLDRDRLAVLLMTKPPTGIFGVMLPDNTIRGR